MTDAARRPDADARFADFVESRDPAALAAVFDATAPQLLLVAMHLTGDAADAEDLVQQTFLEAIRGADRFEPGRRVLPWLLTILERRAIDRRRRRRPRADSAALEAWTANGPTPLDAAARAETAEIVATALDGLPARYHQVLTLRFVHGLNVTEIAGALRRPVGTVHAQIHRGLALLQRALPKEIVPVVAAVLLGRERGIAAVREAVLKAVPAPVAATAAGGIGAMGWIASAVLAGVTMTVWWLWPAPAKLAQAPAATTLVGQTDDAAGPTARTELRRTVTTTREAPLRERTGAPPPDPDDPDAIRFSGRVVAAESREPLTGVEVFFRQSKAKPIGPRLPGDAHELTAERLVTAADGRFDFLAKRRFGTQFDVLMRHPERVRRGGFYDDLSSPTSLTNLIDMGDVAMHRGSRLVGRVVDAHDRPTSAGLTIRLGDPDTRGLPGAALGDREFHGIGGADQDGILDATPVVVPYGTWELFDSTTPVIAPTSITARPEHPVVPVTIRVRKPTVVATIEGQLVDPEGRPVPEVGVGAWSDGARSFLTAAKTDAAGRFTLELQIDAERDPVHLRVTARGLHGWTTLAPAESVRWGARDITVVARPPRPVVFEVIDAATKAPLEDYGLEVGAADDTRQLAAFGKHPHGRAEVGFLGDGEIDVAVIPASRDLRIARRRLRIPADRIVRIAVASGTPLAVQMIADGRPFSDARVRVAHTRTFRRGSDGNHWLGDPRAWFGTGHGSTGIWFDDEAYTDAAGLAHLLVDSQAHEQGVFVEHPGGRTAFVPLPESPWPSPLRVELESAGSVRGAVLHPALARTIATRVTLVREIEGRFQRTSYRGDDGPHWIETPIATDGRFDATGLRPGRYRVGFEGGIVGDPPTLVDVHAGEITEVALDPRPLLPGRLVVHVTIDGQAPPQTAGLWLLRMGGADAPGIRQSHSGLVRSPDGTLRVEELAAGTFRVAGLRDLDGSVLPIVSTSSFAVEPGGENEVWVDMQTFRVRLELRRRDGSTIPPTEWTTFPDAPIVGHTRDCAVHEEGEIHVAMRSERSSRRIPTPLTWFRDGATLVERVVTLED